MSFPRVLFVMDEPVDRRCLRYEPDPEALATAARLQPGWRRRKFRLARLFVRIDRKAAYLETRAASFREFAARAGYDPEEAQQTMLLGYAFEEPGLEEALMQGEITWSAACAIGQIHRGPDLWREEDTWLAWATTEPFTAFSRRVRERREAVRQRSRIRWWMAGIAAETKDLLARCRTLASGRAKRALTNGQLLRILATAFVLDADPSMLPPGLRRMRPTVLDPDRRGVAAETLAGVFRRSGGLCEFGQCDRPAVHLCHVRPHREGSAREAEDLVHGCAVHHKLYDLGRIRLVGWTADGRPIFEVRHPDGRVERLEPKPRPEDRRRAWLPRWVTLGLGPRMRRVASKVLAAVGAKEAARAGAEEARKRPEKPPGDPPGGPPPAAAGAPPAEPRSNGAAATACDEMPPLARSVASAAGAASARSAPPRDRAEAEEPNAPPPPPEVPHAPDAPGPRMPPGPPPAPPAPPALPIVGDPDRDPDPPPWEGTVRDRAPTGDVSPRSLSPSEGHGLHGASTLRDRSRRAPCPAGRAHPTPARATPPRVRRPRPAGRERAPPRAGAPEGDGPPSSRAPTAGTR